MQAADVLTVEEAAERLRLSRGKCYEAVRQGLIPAIRIGRMIRISRAALDDFIRGATAAPTGGSSHD